MSKKRAIDLQLIKPISGATNMKGKITLINLQKELLTDLNIPFFDICCPLGSQSPLGFPVRFEDDEIQYFNGTTWITISTGGDPLRFGVAGEDDTAGENRNFQTGANDFWISDSGDDNAYMALWGGTDIDLWSSDLVDNDAWAEFYLTPTRVSIWMGDNTDLEIENIDQDNAVTKVLGITTGTNLVRWIDKSTIAGSIPTYAVLTSPFVSDPGFSGGGTTFYDILGLSIALLANSTYEIESEIFFKDNGAGEVREYFMNFSTAPISGGISYNLVGVQGLTGTHTDSVTFGNPGIGSTDWTTHYITNFASATISSNATVDMWSLRVKAVVTTDAAVTTMKAQAGLFGGGGNWVAGLGSFIKATKIA